MCLLVGARPKTVCYLQMYRLTIVALPVSGSMEVLGCNDALRLRWVRHGVVCAAKAGTVGSSHAQG